MKARIFNAPRIFLIIWGAVSFAATIAFVAVFAYQFGYGNTEKIDKSSVRDVRFVLNWSGLGEDRIEKVIHSHVSSRSFTGDHLDAYAIKISRLDVAELTAAKDEHPSRWFRGDQLPSVARKAVEFLGWSLNGGEVEWFPKEAELRSASVYVYPVSIHFHGVWPTAAELIFVRPSDNMIFYFGAKT